MALEAEKCTLSTVRYIIEEVIKEFPNMESSKYGTPQDLWTCHRQIAGMKHCMPEVCGERSSGYVQKDPAKSKFCFRSGIHYVAGLQKTKHSPSQITRSPWRCQVQFFTDIKYLWALFSMMGIWLDRRCQRLLLSNFEVPMYLFTNCSQLGDTGYFNNPSTRYWIRHELIANLMKNYRYNVYMLRKLIMFFPFL